MERRLQFDGCCNFRDLGGYRTRDGLTIRWRRLFRSDSLHYMSEADVARLVEELGAKTIIDLRMTSERARAGFVNVDRTVRALHLPIIDDSVTSADADGTSPKLETLADMYAVTLRAGSAGIGQVLRVLASPDAYPAVFSCSSGKDRTGLLAAIVLALLGVSDDDIVADYTLTAPALAVIGERVRREEPDFEQLARQLPPDLLDAPPGAMTATLQRIRDEHGSVEGYAAHAGITRDVIESLRDNLLE
jgi:protein tyrosine/serine phosphatase